MRSRTSRSPRLALLISIAAALVVSLVAPGRWSSAQGTSDLVGDYAVSIGSNDIPPDLASGSVLVGRWHLAFLADGTYFAERLDIGRVVSGTYEVDGETLTVTDEEGLISCANASAATGGQGDVATGSYAVAVDDDILALTVAEDGCRTRSVLFGTRDFGQFVACLTNAPAAADATPVAADATPVGDEGLDTGSAEGDNDGGIFDLLTPAAGQDPAADEEDDGDEGDEGEDDPAADEDEPAEADAEADVDAEIDALLGQLTACWQTQDAEQFLPLLTEEFQGAFLVVGSPEEQISELEELMIQPLTWERAGDIEVSGDDEASVVVRLSVAGADQFITYRFLLGEDGWQWDGAEE